MLLNDLEHELLSDLTQCLAKQGRPVGRSVIQPGEQAAWDEPCNGGMAYVRTSDIGLRSETSSGVTGKVCNFVVGATITLGVARCTPSISSSGRAPSAAQITASGEENNLDALTLLDVAMQVTDGQILSWVPIGPSGGMVGGEVQFSVALPWCSPCEVSE